MKPWVSRTRVISILIYSSRIFLLVLHQIPLANRCFLREEEEETIDHLLIHCSRAKMLWDLILVIVGSNRVFPLTVRHALLAWQGAKVGKNRKRVWMTSPLCLFRTLWKERNRAAFEDKVPSIHIMKASFLCTLWAWAKLYSVDNTFFGGFFGLVGYR